MMQTAEESSRQIENGLYFIREIQFEDQEGALQVTALEGVTGHGFTNVEKILENYDQKGRFSIVPWAGGSKKQNGEVLTGKIRKIGYVNNAGTNRISLAFYEFLRQGEPNHLSRVVGYWPGSSKNKSGDIEIPSDREEFDNLQRF